MLPRQQARGRAEWHRMLLGAKARARNGTTSPVGKTALGSCNALVGHADATQPGSPILLALISTSAESMLVATIRPVLYLTVSSVGSSPR